MQFFRFEGGESILIDVSKIKGVYVEIEGGCGCYNYTVKYFKDNEWRTLQLDSTQNAIAAKEQLDAAVAAYYASPVVEAVEMKR
jgi:hypothetical protein